VSAEEPRAATAGNSAALLVPTLGRHVARALAVTGHVVQLLAHLHMRPRVGLVKSMRKCSAPTGVVALATMGWRGRQWPSCNQPSMSGCLHTRGAEGWDVGLGLARRWGGCRWRWWRRSWRRGKGSGNQGVVLPGALWGGCRDGGGSTGVRSVASTPSHGSHPHRSHATQTTTKRCSGAASRHGRGWEKKGGRRCRETAGEGRGWAPKWPSARR
jgi:hypothetical protein